MDMVWWMPMKPQAAPRRRTTAGRDDWLRRMAQLEDGASISFTGSAVDAEDGNLSSSLNSGQMDF